VPGKPPFPPLVDVIVLKVELAVPPPTVTGKVPGVNVRPVPTDKGVGVYVSEESLRPPAPPADAAKLPSPLPPFPPPATTR
jgi:hypothetical protein